MPVKVYSGIAPPKALLDAMAAAALQPSPFKLTSQPTSPAGNSENRPPMPPRPATSQPVTADSSAVYDDAPPSYEDAMAENLAPVDGPRREYHPPDTSTVESGADGKNPVQAGRLDEEGSTAEGFTGSSSRARRSSSESFDMLPTTPPESISGSPPTSPVGRSQSTIKVSRRPVFEESPPQYQPLPEGQLQSPNPVERRASGNNPRPMNLGVPIRKPVPRSPDRNT